MSVSTVFVHQEFYDTASARICCSRICDGQLVLRVGDDLQLFITDEKAEAIVAALQEKLRTNRENLGFSRAPPMNSPALPTPPALKGVPDDEVPF